MIQASGNSRTCRSTPKIQIRITTTPARRKLPLAVLRCSRDAAFNHGLYGCQPRHCRKQRQVEPAGWNRNRPGQRSRQRFAHLANPINRDNSSIHHQCCCSAPLEPLAIANPGGPTNQVAQTISGTVDPSYAGTAVTILDTYNGVTTPLGTTTVGSGGAWTTRALPFQEPARTASWRRTPRPIGRALLWSSRSRPRHRR